MADTFEENTVSKTTNDSVAARSIFDAPILLSLVLLFLCSTVYIRRVPKLNKSLVGKGGPLRFVAILSGQFDYILSFSCLFCAFYVLFFY